MFCVHKIASFQSLLYKKRCLILPTELLVSQVDVLELWHVLKIRGFLFSTLYSNWKVAEKENSLTKDSVNIGVTRLCLPLACGDITSLISWNKSLSNLHKVGSSGVSTFMVYTKNQCFPWVAGWSCWVLVAGPSMSTLSCVSKAPASPVLRCSAPLPP